MCDKIKAYPYFTLLHTQTDRQTDTQTHTHTHTYKFEWNYYLAAYHIPTNLCWLAQIIWHLCLPRCQCCHHTWNQINTNNLLWRINTKIFVTNGNKPLVTITITIGYNCSCLHPGQRTLSANVPFTLRFKIPWHHDSFDAPIMYYYTHSSFT